MQRVIYPYTNLFRVIHFARNYTKGKLSELTSRIYLINGLDARLKHLPTVWLQFTRASHQVPPYRTGEFAYVSTADIE